MHSVASRRLCRRDYIRDAEVALRRGWRTDAHGLLGQLDVQCVAVGRRVDRDRLDPELVQGTDHADGDLATVCDEHAVEHVGS